MWKLSKISNEIRNCSEKMDRIKRKNPTSEMKLEIMIKTTQEMKMGITKRCNPKIGQLAVGEL